MRRAALPESRPPLRACVLALTLALASGCSRGETERGTPDAGQRPRVGETFPTTSASAVASGARPTELGLAIPSATASARRTFDLPDRSAAAPHGREPWGSLPWRSHRGDGFSVMLPGEPKDRTLPADDDRGAFHELRVDLASGQATFVVGTSEHSEEEVKDPDAFLEEHIDAPRHGLADVLVKRAITLPGGHHGRVLVFRRRPAGATRALRIYSRQYLVGRRLYALVLSTYDEDGAPEDVARRFMESFKVDPP